MVRRIVAGIGAGCVYVVLVRLAFVFVDRMRDQAAAGFSHGPVVWGTSALIGVGALTALAVVYSYRLPALPWTAGALLFVLIPTWLFLPWYPELVRQWLGFPSFSLGLETTPLLAGLMLTLAVRVTWFVERSPSSPQEGVQERVITAE